MTAAPPTVRDPRMAEVVLATDLDGTFLGGSDEERSRLYAAIDANRDHGELVEEFRKRVSRDPIKRA